MEKITQLLFAHVCCCCCFCCYWQPVNEVCPNYEEVDFQHWKLTTMDLGSISYCYVDYFLEPPHPLLLPSGAMTPSTLPSILVLHGIIGPPSIHLSSPQHTEKPLPAFSSPVTSRYRPLLSSLAPTIPDGLPPPPLPHCHRNIF